MIGKIEPPDSYEVVWPECGDDPDLDYRDVSIQLQRIRGPYPFAAGRDAHEKHVRSHHEQNLAACERVLGPDHPATLQSRNNLANAYQAAGRSGEV